MRTRIALIVLLGAAVLAPTAGARTQSAQSGAVTASFSFSGHYPNYSGERLTIARRGQVVYSQPVVSSFCGSQCAPASPSARQVSVRVLDLEANGEPDVVLELFSGGAHCCSIEQIFSFDPGTASYVKTERNFGDPGAQIVDLGHHGRHEFLTADDRFAYEFTDYAASGLPIQILTFANRRFTDVTRGYPRLIAKDAAIWRRLFTKLRRYHYSDSVGVVAAWAADELLLGHKRLVDRFLSAQIRAGHLNAANGQPAGRRFLSHLRRFLRRHGYLR